jgi:hypothetical protein
MTAVVMGIIKVKKLCNCYISSDCAPMGSMSTSCCVHWTGVHAAEGICREENHGNFCDNVSAAAM